MKKTVIIAGIALVIIAISGVWFLRSKTALAPTEAADHKNATYLVEGQSVTLTNGRAETLVAPNAAAKTITQYFGNEATGDMNGDGASDVAFLLTQNSGGSGTFYYVVVALRKGGGYEGTNAFFLGDRIAPQTTELRDGKLVVNYGERKEGEPMTAAPSVGVSKYLKVEGGVLKEIEVAGQTESEAVCTKEALLCPDGTYVSRHGEKCAFDSCPNTGPLVGKLQQVSGEFQLIMGSPATNTQGVAYALPLRIKISNALTSLVGQKVKAYGAFGEGITFNADRIEALPKEDVTLGRVAVGQTVFVNGVRITLNSIVGDSRCPTGVQCIWAGSVIANVTLQSDTDKETRDIDSSKAPVPLDSFLISIARVEPQPVAGQKPDVQSYVLEFKVVNR